MLSDTGYPYIVRQSTNNGQKGFLQADKSYLNEGNTISFGQDTATVYYQECPYFTGDKIKILKSKDPHFHKGNAPFFLVAIQRAFSGFTWGSQSFSEKVIKKMNIVLPQTADGNIDFAFMEDIVHELEVSYLHILEKYLSVTGLNNNILNKMTTF